jgi:hypothetical protein
MKGAHIYCSWSHVVTMMCAQILHALRLRLGSLFTVRPSTMNTLSHANKVRDCAMAEKLFWAMLSHLQAFSPRLFEALANVD